MRFKFVLIVIVTALWSGESHSRVISYSDLSSLVKENNGKVLALDSEISSQEALTGSLARSFVPEFKLFAGTEHFNSKGLGTHPSQFFGATTTLNLFNGMRDYWEEEKRKQGIELAEIQKLATFSTMLFEARKAFLVIVQIEKVKSIYKDNLDRISQIERKVSGKVKGGVISRSELNHLGLLRIGLREDIRTLSREMTLAKAALKSALGLSGDIEIKSTATFLNSHDKEFSDKKSSKSYLLARKFEVQSEIYKKASKVESNVLLPSIGLYASYQRQPFSQREILIDQNRDELRTGILASWSLEEGLEMRSKSQSLDWKAEGARRLSEFHQSDFNNQIEALNSKKRLLQESLSQITEEFKLGKNYYKQISSEYLRGVKSTSDLTTAFNQILTLQRKKIDLAVEFKMAQAQVEVLSGEF